MSAKAEILRRIRSATEGGATGVEVPRDYDRAALTGGGDVERFAETVDDYRAQVYRVVESEIAATIRGLLADGARVVIPADVPSAWVDGVTTVPDDGLSVKELDAVDAVVTGCRVGIAATGTIVLDAGEAQGRRALTLVPDHHICIVRAEQVVDTVPQAFAVLDASRPLTFISGPSATSDIELNRVEGVHGPRRLDVLIVG
ncbi:lactate utilization protein C [Rhodococcus sp. BP-149]|uniref:LutC/YkgG family protein n=1 Tax=unclassified Rhodococcus (in: high G+C Gram-positive bacteria) TaxID=192944 RepID=UPI001C9A55D9|nr:MULTISPECIES: lactate utilization protein C [unclassified Rhodococcus (in: high G+C Gram-positive bacteria)]MBY6687198.1 lactate utilization protein C [Rhodococcus sp. BP-288]MBY6694379.1 lactate utilization protein C [Rhodococcus sp. BP-188]MBY6698088.1 lactate utilization protein C [Rhodococcus sp. BP-285]MBY6704308.1 lactate utilization protein C [Rhodococcus sp. BP-283]MBY6712957.1 lactate utilization protein C [Rhodococcus sp. BP-160]